MSVELDLDSALDARRKIIIAELESGLSRELDLPDDVAVKTAITKALFAGVQVAAAAISAQTGRDIRLGRPQEQIDADDEWDELYGSAG